MERNKEPQRLAALPAHPLEPAVGDGQAKLRIDGLVERVLELGAEELVALLASPRVTWQAPFSCQEGWVVPSLTWEGWPLRALLDLAQPLPTARAVAVSAGSYSLWLTLEEAGQALLCDRLNGAPLTREHGAPWRLLLPGGQCYTSVKWVDTLLVSETLGLSTAGQLARQRLQARHQSGARS